jgi:hypothetical protein
MNASEIKECVIAAYQKEPDEFKNVRVSEVVADAFGGNLAVVKYQKQDGSPNDEICFISPEGSVRVFETTEELARYLEQKAKAPLLERLFTRPIMSGIVFVFLLVAVFITGFNKDFRPEALSILGSVVGVAAGFFFGSGKT